MKGFLVFFVLLLNIILVYGNKKDEVEEMYYWREVIYEDLPYHDNYMIGKYPYHVPSNNDLLALGYHAQSGLMLATVGRIRPGVPSTLNAFCVSDYEKGTSPHIWGFPDYERNTLKASFYGDRDDARILRRKDKYSAGYFNHFYSNYATSQNSKEDFSIIEVYGPLVDNRCNRLFVIDVGIIRYGATEVYQPQNPALIIFELPPHGCETRKFPVIRRVELPQHVWKNPLGYMFNTLDYKPKGTCDDVFMYSNSLFDNNLLVYDYKNNEFWAFDHPSMQPINVESNFFLAPDYHWQLPMGIVNVALGWPDKKGNRNAYYFPGASTGEYVVSTKVLKDRKRAPTNYHPGDFSLIAYRGCESQAIKQVFDEETGVMFFGEMQSNRVRCWNTQLPLNSDTIGVVFESDIIPFIADLFIDPYGYLWFHSNRLPLMFTSNIQLDITDINSRTFRIKVSDAIKGTVCDTYKIFNEDVVNKYNY